MNKKVLLIVFVLVIELFLVSCSSENSSSKGPEEVVRAYLESIIEWDLDSAEKYVTGPEKESLKALKMMSEEDEDVIKEQAAEAKVVDTELQDSDDSKASVKATVENTTDGMEYEAVYRLIKEDGLWKVESSELAY